MENNKIFCPICDASSATHIQSHPDFVTSDIYHCSSCNCWFASPQPDQHSLEKYYREIYSPQRQKYFGKQYYALMQRRAKAQVEFIIQGIQSSQPTYSLSRKKALDLGCGIGSLVVALQQNTLEAIGYDGDAEAIKIGRSLWNSNIFEGSVDLTSAKHSFDLLCLSHFIEHLQDIRRTLKDICAVVKTGGYIFVEVPDCFPQMFEYGVDTESHIYFFTKFSLKRLLELLDLQVLMCKSCGPPKLAGYNLPQASDSSRMIRSTMKIWSKLSSLAQPVLHSIKWLLPIRTAYDGYYSHYYGDDEFGGMWLRVLAKKT